MYRLTIVTVLWPVWVMIARSLTPAAAFVASPARKLWVRSAPDPSRPPLSAA